MPPLHQKKFSELLLSEGGVMLLLRLSQAISSGCHHVTPTHKKIGIFIIAGGGHYASAST